MIYSLWCSPAKGGKGTDFSFFTGDEEPTTGGPWVRVIGFSAASDEEASRIAMRAINAITEAAIRKRKDEKC